MKDIFSLFWSFFKIGTFTFGGGYAMIPLIESEVVRKKAWIRKGEFLELLTLAQSAPGPISLNTAVFVGYSVRGYSGAIAAVMGVIIPSFVIILILAIYLVDLRTNRYVDAAFKGMRPAVVALIAAPIINLARGMGLWKILAAIAAALIVWHFGASPIWFIVGGAAVGIAYAFYDRKGVPVPGNEAAETPAETDRENSNGNTASERKEKRAGENGVRGGGL